MTNKTPTYNQTKEETSGFSFMHMMMLSNVFSSDGHSGGWNPEYGDMYNTYQQQAVDTLRSGGETANPDGTFNGGTSNLGGTYDSFLSHLELREGVRNTVYKDSLGKLTVGVGHLVLPEDGLKLGDTISDEQVQGFLEKDAQGAWNAALQQADELGVTDPKMVEALASVNYQLGTNWNKEFKNTWAAMKDGDWDKAATNVEQSLWNNQTPVRVDDFQAALRSQEKAPELALS